MSAANTAQLLRDCDTMPTIVRLATQRGILAAYIGHPAIYAALGLPGIRRARPVPPRPLPGAVVRRIRVRP